MAGKKPGFTMWQAIRDIFVRAIDKGQLLGLGLIFILLLVIWKLPPEDLSAKVDQILKGFETKWIFGWVLNCVLVVAWLVHAKIMVRMTYKEQDRIADERNKAQMALGAVSGSSKV